MFVFQANLVQRSLYYQPTEQVIYREHKTLPQYSQKQ